MTHVKGRQLREKGKCLNIVGGGVFLLFFKLKSKISKGAQL